MQTGNPVSICRMTQQNEQPQRLSSELIEVPETDLFQAPLWSDSPSGCSLVDAERHLGHIINAGEYWIAFDATHLNGTRTGFAVLGTFPEIGSAKRAVEESCGVVATTRLQVTIH